MRRSAGLAAARRTPARDPQLFAPGRLADLRATVGDLSWLLSCGYQEASALAGEILQRHLQQASVIPLS